MPRKYRPPAARRRKGKRAAPVYVEPLPEDGGTPSPAPDAISEIEAPEAPPPREERPLRHSGRRDGGETAAPVTKHIARDYSYVRAEVRRIVVVAGFLLAALIITALLRN